MGLRYDNKSIDILCQKYGIRFLGVFGSRARGDFKSTSDTDVLIRYATYSSVRSILDQIAVQNNLSIIFGGKVDLVEESGLNKDIAPNVKKELVAIYENR
ncbi:MAG: nucleotidyltransferase domain-containing protein [Patescibacteria group bacterium]